jgi:hypothetical protein
MDLYCDWDVVRQDVYDIVKALASGGSAHHKHTSLAKDLTNEHAPTRKSAKIAIIANCGNCAADVSASLHSVWERGSPVQISFDRTRCPECGGTSGFNYKRASHLHI